MMTVNTQRDNLECLPILNGCPCVVLRDEEHAVAVLDEMISSRSGGYSVAVNAEKMVLYGSRADVRDLIDGANLPYADGAGAVLALRWLYGRDGRKINMPLACLDGAERCGWRIFIMGAREEVNREAVAQIATRYPNTHVVGRLNGYEPDDRKIEAVKGAQPDLVMVALGSPAQELFAAKLLRHVPNTFVVGCGGALDVLAGRAKRAPRFMVENNLEWLYRLLREPHRWRRQMVLPYFFVRLLGATWRRGARNPATRGTS